MGRARGNTPTVSPDSAAARRDGDLDAQLHDEFVAADLAAPRHGTASTAADRHPHSNEDRGYCDHDNGVAAVFDGMGGHAGGELASRAACGAFALAAERLPADRDGRARWLAAALAQAGQAVRVSRRVHPGAPTQGAAAAACALAGEVALVASVGDCRVYHADAAGTLRQLSADRDGGPGAPDAAMQARLDTVSSERELDEDAALARHFARRNIISDELAQRARPVTVSEHPVAAGDLLIVCSDGVHDNLTTGELQRAVAAHRPGGAHELAGALELLTRRRARQGPAAHVRAKDDDITVCVLPC